MIIKNAKIHNGLGQEAFVSDLRISDGLIKEIGKDLTAQADEAVLDASGHHLYPGFIDPATPWGLQRGDRQDLNESCNPITPMAETYYAFNPRELERENVASVGVTSLGISTGSHNLIAGQMSAFHSVGTKVNDMLLNRNFALRASLGNQVKEVHGKHKQTPMTRMGAFSLLDSFFLGELTNSEEAKIRDRVLAGDLPLWIQVQEDQDIASALMYFEKFEKLKLVFIGAFSYENYLDEICKRKIPLVFNDQIYLSYASYAKLNLSSVQRLLDEDIPVSFTTATPYGATGRVHYFWNAARFIEAGIDPELALKVMTANPARLLGIEKQTGSIELGKYADLVLTKGDYLTRYDAHIVKTFVKGRVVYDRKEDIRFISKNAEEASC